MQKVKITLQCQDCGDYINRDPYCQYTGHVHSEGWKYKCTCGGAMNEVDYKKGGACAFALDLVEAEIRFVIQLKRFTEMEWKTRAKAMTGTLAKMLYDGIVKYKNYGDEVRMQYTKPNGEVETT